MCTVIHVSKLHVTCKMSKLTFGCLCKLLELLLFSFINDFIILFILLTILQKRSVNTESGQSVNFACHKYMYVMLWKNVYVDIFVF